MLKELTLAAQSPVLLSSPASGATPMPHSANPRTSHVLLIEPDPDCADALATILSSLPHIAAVQVVAGLRDAAEALRTGSIPPAIILVDDQPGSTEILRVIDILSELAPDTALVLLCVYPQCVDRRVRARVSDCVSKDVTRQELAQVVERVLRSV